MLNQNGIVRKGMASFLLICIFFFQSASSQIFYGPNGLGGLFKWDLSTNTLTNHVSIPDMTGDLIKRSTGRNYGLVSSGGNNSSGFIFYLTPAGIPTPIFHFPLGQNPRGTLFEGNDTKLYGIINNGVFRYDPENNSFSMVFETITEGILGSKLMQASDGNFYGTENLSNPDRLFRIIPNGGTVGTYQLLYNFTNEIVFNYYDDENGNEVEEIIDKRAEEPVDQTLLEITPGIIYGTTRHAGAYNDFSYGWPVGTIWSFDLADSVFTPIHRHMGSFGYVSFGLTQASNGRLYSMTEDILYGSIYSIDPASLEDEAEIIRLENGLAYPQNGLLTEGTDGRLYAIVTSALDDDKLGGVVAFDTSSKQFTSFQFFDGTNGNNPSGTMVEAESAALPLKLLSFSGKEVNKNIQLRWTTADEEGFDRFTIERSGNGNNFSSIGTVAGGKSEYQFIDANPALVNFYRLKMSDIDGQFRYSETLQVNMNETGAQVLVFPSPVSSQLQVQLRGYNEMLTIEIFDMAGTKMKQQRVMAAGSITATINVDKLRSGMYSIIVRGAKESKTTIFYKR